MRCSAGHGKCLQDEVNKDYLEIERQTNEKYLPGENYSANKQCEMIYGSDARICSFMVSDVRKLILIKLVSSLTFNSIRLFFLNLTCQL